VKQVSAWKMSSEGNRSIEGAARSTRKIVGGVEQKLPEKKTHHISTTQFDSPTSPHTHWVVIRPLSEGFSSLVVEPVNSGPIVGEVVHTARGKVDPSI
jgi:hypothetical protein